MVALMHLFSASAAWMQSAAISLTCTECGERHEAPVDEILARHGEDCTIGQVVAESSCRRCGSPFVTATPACDEDDDED